MKKTVVRIPGPSSIDIRWISRTLAVGSSLFIDLDDIKLYSPGLKHIMAYPLDDFILKLSANSGKICIVSGDSHKQVSVILGIFLGVKEYF